MLWEDWKCGSAIKANDFFACSGSVRKYFDILGSQEHIAKQTQKLRV